MAGRGCAVRPMRNDCLPSNLGCGEDHLVADARGAAHDDAQPDAREHVRGAAHARPEGATVRQLKRLCAGAGLRAGRCCLAQVSGAHRLREVTVQRAGRHLLCDAH